MFEDPKWIEASGRISSMAANVLRRMAKIGIRPLLGMKKGVLVPVGIKARAKDIPTAIFRKFEADLRKSKKEIRVVVTHGDDLEGAQRLKEMIETEFKNAKVIFINIIDDILASITGPNTITCAWYEK
jgi:fatty acid-binding protein DegV